MEFQNWQMVKAPFASAEGLLTTQLYYSMGTEHAEYKALIQSKHESICGQCHNRETKEGKTKPEILCSTQRPLSLGSKWTVNGE